MPGASATDSALEYARADRHNRCVRTALPRLTIVNPVPQQRGGNRVTALRWAWLFRKLGWHVTVEESWSGTPCEVLVALHARKSHSSVVRFKREHPELPVIVAGTGTDLYSDVADGGEARESFGLASRIVVLQPNGVEKLDPELRPRARVIYQSVVLPRGPRPPRRADAFQVCVIANLRPVKDPLRTAHAARLLPPTSRIAVVHLGALLDEFLKEELEEECRTNPRFTWLGERPRVETLRELARSRLCVVSSRHEGGPNALSEALALGTPVLATRIPGNAGLLGEDYPGYFPVGDEAALCDLMNRAERDGPFLEALTEACRAHAHLTDPAQELASWRELLDETRSERRDPRDTPV